MPIYNPTDDVIELDPQLDQRQIEYGTIDIIKPGWSVDERQCETPACRDLVGWVLVAREGHGGHETENPEWANTFLLPSGAIVCEDCAGDYEDAPDRTGFYKETL